MTIEFDSARLAYGGHVALDEVSLRIVAGTLTVLLGPNGSGKSTLLDAIAGLLTPVSGAVRVSAGGTGDRTRAGPPVAYVMQQTGGSALLPISAQEVVRLGRYARRGMLGRLGKQDHVAVADAMRRMEVQDLAEQPLRALSGGQRQRVLVAQGLAQEAPVLLLDEPMNGLDLVSRQHILDVIAEECAAGRTVVVSTHDLSEARAADAVVLLAGRLVAHGPAADVLTAPNLQRAYGGRFIRLPDDDLTVDEHGHAHDDGAHSIRL